MNRPLLLLLIFALLAVTGWLLSRLMKSTSTEIVLPTKKPDSSVENTAYFKRLQNKAAAAKLYGTKRGFSSRFAFLVDMSLPSGRNRFFVYDLQKNFVLYAGLVAHGSCNTRFMATARFSNQAGCGCSSIGRYKVGEAYQGRFGRAFKLYGLDSTNSHAYERAVVLHGYGCVPEAEIDPMPLCNSLGCTMVSYKFLALAKGVIEKEKKPVLLWVYNDGGKGKQ